MKTRLPAIVTALLCLSAACTKQAEQKNSGTSAASAPKPRGSPAEALGFASESPEGYFQSSPAPNARAPEPATTSTAPSRASSAAPVRRKLTAKDGRSVDAELLAGNAEAVKIRRSADATVFTIPLAQLSDADRDFIRSTTLPPL